MPKQALVPKRGGFSKLGYAGEELRPSSSEYQQLRWVGRMRLECWNGWREGWMGWIDGWVVSWLGRIDGGGGELDGSEDEASGTRIKWVGA